MEQDKISCSILFSMFWGQIGVKIVFSVKMQKNSAVKQRVYGTFWLRESANYFMYNISLFLQKENSIIGDT